VKYEIHFTEMFHQFLPEIDEDKKIILSDKTNIIESIPINKIKLPTRNVKDFDPQKHDFVEIPYAPPCMAASVQSDRKRNSKKAINE